MISQNVILERFKAIHGDKYNYAKVESQGTRQKVIITCRVHGDFMQLPHDHYNGRGCRECFMDRNKHSLVTIKEKGNELFGDKYDYSHITRDGNMISNILCHEHGLFNSLQTNHLAGHGCKKCAIKRSAEASKNNIHRWIEKARNVHGDLYEYDINCTATCHQLTSIACKTHGIFMQRWANHISGKQGCPRCNKMPGRYSTEYFTLHPERRILPASLYIIKMLDDSRIFYKIGISKRIDTRLRVIPYKSEIIHQETGELYDMFLKEQNFLKSHGYQNRYTPKIKFGGDKECFILPEEQILRYLA